MIDRYQIDDRQIDSQIARWIGGYWIYNKDRQIERKIDRIIDRQIGRLIGEYWIYNKYRQIIDRQKDRLINLLIVRQEDGYVKTGYTINIDR